MTWNDLGITPATEAIPFKDKHPKSDVAQEGCYSSFFLAAEPTLSLSTLYSGTTDALNLIRGENETLIAKVFQEESKGNLSLGGCPRKSYDGEKSPGESDVPSPEHALPFMNCKVTQLSGSLCTSENKAVMISGWACLLDWRRGSNKASIHSTNTYCVSVTVLGPEAWMGPCPKRPHRPQSDPRSRLHTGITRSRSILEDFSLWRFLKMVY
ncbi:uncharacterized protein AAG666_023648 isoform 1-T5 [Megaptera novaeangliae]